MNFDELKQKVLKRAKEKGACSGGYKAALKSKTASALLEVIKENIGWVVSINMMTPDEIREWFGEKLCTAHDIYFSGNHILMDRQSIHFGSSTSEHYGSSTSKHYDSSTSKHYDSSTSEHYGSSTSEHFGSSTSEHYGSSTSKHYESSTSEHYESSTSKHYGSSTSYVSNDVASHKLFDSSVIRDLSNNALYVRKDSVNIFFGGE